MRITFLGTGDAGGVPRYGCDCPACTRARTEVKFRRLPCTALVEVGATRILLDAGLTDLAERFKPGTLSAIVLTHFHPDHVQGLFHLRWGSGPSIAVFGPPDTQGCADLYKNHGLLKFSRLEKFAPIQIGELTLTPLPLIHSKPTFGYVIEDGAGHRFAYLTDTKGLPPQTEEFLKDGTVCGLAIDCTFAPHPNPSNHNDLTQALTVIERIHPQHAWLTHVGHELDTWLQAHHGGDLPPHVSVVRDGDCVFQPAAHPVL